MSTVVHCGWSRKAAIGVNVNYCQECGSRMELRAVDGDDRLACTNCDFVHWGTFSIGVGGLVIRDDKVLLVRRMNDPGKGRWTNPGGYSEEGETIDVAVEREVFEETGVRARVDRVIALRDQSRKSHNLYVAFAMSYESGEPKPDEHEVDAAGFFTRDEMKSMNVAALTQWLVDVAFGAESNGLQPHDHDFGYPGLNRLFQV